MLRKKMYSTIDEILAGCEDCFVPIVRDDGVAPCVRRYALTTMGSKYLKIGIDVGPTVDVEVLLGDNGNHLIL